MLSGASEPLQQLSSKHLEISTKLPKCFKYYEALVALNKRSIAAAGDASVLSKVYEEKAQIYLKLGHHEHCLSCLEELKRILNTDENATGLEDKTSSAQDNNDSTLISQSIFENFFKLSHPPHPRLPFLVNCLELRENDDFGKHVITSQELKAGDVIAIEKSYFHFISPHAIFERCFNCFRSNKLDLRTFGMESAAGELFCHWKEIERN